MSKVIDIINNSDSAFASFELVPPLKGRDSEVLVENLKKLLDFAPPFINVTCHRDEMEFKQNPDGSYQKMILTRRPSTIAIVATIMKHYSGEVVPHVICGGASMTHIESELLDFNFLGIENVMALRGDAMPGQKKFIPEPDGYSHSNELVDMIQQLNHGNYIDPNVEDGVSTHFCVGVAGYPEKHFEAANPVTDIQNLKRKVDAGADYVITQMFFDNAVFYRFVDQCRSAGINVPIIPGLKPISSVSQIDSLPRTFHIDVPEPLTQELRKSKSKAEAYAIGVDWCIAQCKDLITNGHVPAIHFYTMGKASNVRSIVKAVF